MGRWVGRTGMLRSGELGGRQLQPSDSDRCRPARDCVIRFGSGGSHRFPTGRHHDRIDATAILRLLNSRSSLPMRCSAASSADDLGPCSKEPSLLLHRPPTGHTWGSHAATIVRSLGGSPTARLSFATKPQELYRAAIRKPICIQQTYAGFRVSRPEQQAKSARTGENNVELESGPRGFFGLWGGIPQEGFLPDPLYEGIATKPAEVDGFSVRRRIQRFSAKGIDNGRAGHILVFKGAPSRRQAIEHSVNQSAEGQEMTQPS